MKWVHYDFNQYQYFYMGVVEPEKPLSIYGYKFNALFFQIFCQIG